ncbi:MAG: hypothetical protein AUF79_01090 [Crenarchaeota archaeon 13_1_20CM_2_51_8]|nr:MAG: hypothetical protein AUF79_01090 [Crenarchaeota archaeon 13_1_20CM_2_51_8]
MFTRKASLYFALASVLLILGLFLQDWQLASMVLLLASLFFLSNFFGLPEEVELKVSQRVVPSDSFGEGDISIHVNVSNDRGDVLGNVEVDESLPDAIVLEKGASRMLTQLGSRETAELLLEFHSPIRGRYKIGPLVVRVEDPFGFYHVEKRSEAEILSIMPMPERIRAAELRPRHLGPWPGTIPARTPGPGTEFYSMRDYVSGDDPKRINWKASAKHRRLILKEMEAERVTDVMVVLDTDVSFYEIGEAELFERGVRAAASLASLLLRQGNRVGMILQGEERGVVAPGFGKRHERDILVLLAAAKPGRAQLSTSYVITLLARLMLPAKAQVVIISPLLDATIVDGVRELASARYSILVLSPSPEKPARFESVQEEIAFQMVMLERSNTLLAIEQICTVSQWPSGILLSTILSEVKRPRHMIRV